MSDVLMRLRNTFQKLLGILVWASGVLIFGAVSAIKVVLRPLGFSNSHRVSGPVICVVAGVKGWESIEFREISQSAREYLGKEHVVELSVRSSRDYLRQVWRALADFEVTHYLFDPRTGSQSVVGASFQAAAIGIMLAVRGITPIGYCTDVSHRRWRLQVIFLTALNGVCVCFMDTAALRRIFPHRRIVGPSIMPFSIETFERVTLMAGNRAGRGKRLVSFAGSLYEPRTTMLFQIREALENDGVSFDISTRKLGEPKGPEDSYWAALSGSEIQVTTTSQIRHRGADLSEVNQLVYRATEALVCGAALIIEATPGIGAFFQDGVHICCFSSAEEAASIAKQLLADRSKLANIQRAGHRRIEELIRDQDFWVTVDETLGQFSQPQLVRIETAA